MTQILKSISFCVALANPMPRKKRPNDIPVSISDATRDSDNDSFNRDTRDASGTDNSRYSDYSDSGIGADGFPIGDASDDNAPTGRTRQRSQRTVAGSRRDFGSTSDRTGTGSSGGSGARSNSGTNSTSGTKEGTAIPSEATPRKVAFNALGNQQQKPASLKNQAIAVEFYKEMWQLGFHGLSVFFRDHEWKLPDDDAEELAERTQRLMAAGGVKRLQSAEKMIAKYQPIISLLIAVFAIVIPRLAHTKEMRKNAVNLKTKEAAAGASGAASPASVNRTDNNVPNGTGERSGTVDGAGHNNSPYRPIRREDWLEVYPNDDRLPS